MTLGRTALGVVSMLLLTAWSEAQSVPPAAEAALGATLRLSGQAMRQSLTGPGLERWPNPEGHRLAVRLVDASGDVHYSGTTGAPGGEFLVELPSPAGELLIPVADYSAEIASLFAESYFGPIPLTPSVNPSDARIQRFSRIEVRTADGQRSAGFIQRWRQAETSTTRVSWVFADRDVLISGRADAPGVSGAVDLRLKRGWNRVVMVLTYERGRQGQLLLRTASEPAEMHWVYWELGG